MMKNGAMYRYGDPFRSSRLSQAPRAPAPPGRPGGCTLAGGAGGVLTDRLMTVSFASLGADVGAGLPSADWFWD